VLDKAGLATLERAARGLSQVNGKTGQLSRRRFEVLRAIYPRQRKVPAYAAVCGQIEFSAQDCLVIAAMHEGQDSLCCTTGQVVLRIRRGTEMLLDRACPGGGWSTCVGAGCTDRLMRTARGTHAPESEAREVHKHCRAGQAIPDQGGNHAQANDSPGAV
jgi:hypothetical protein